MTDTAADLSRYITDRMRTGGLKVMYLYGFPNRHAVSVIPDPSQPLRFEIRTDRGQPEPGLTTDEVEARLNEIRNLPPAEN